MPSINWKVVIALGILCLSMSSWADTIRLKNGNVLRGKILKETAQEIVIEVPFGRVSVAKKEIVQIVRDSDEVKNILYQASRLASLGAYDSSVEYLQKEQEKYPEEPRLEEALAEVHLKAGKHYLEKKSLTRARMHLQLAESHGASDAASLLREIDQKERHALKLQREADALLQRKEPGKAIERYLGLLETYPEWEERVAPNLSLACVQVANGHYSEKDYKAAISHFDLALQYRPEVFPMIEPIWLSANIHWIVQNYMDKGQWHEAAEALGKLLKVSPSSREAIYFLGTSYEQLRQPGNAFACYQKLLGQNRNWSGDVGELADTRDLARRESGIAFVEGSESEVPPDTAPAGRWNELVTPHFRIFYYHPQLAARVANHLEYHWYQIQHSLAPTSFKGEWKIPCQVFIHPSKQQYLQTTGMDPWSEGVSQLEHAPGRLKSHKIQLYQSAPLLSSSIVPHELTHVLYPWFMKYKGNLPLWLNEGLAMCSEPAFRQRYRLRTIRMALRSGSAYPLSSLCSMRNYPSAEKEVEIYYAQSFAVVYFLLQNFGKDRLWEFAGRAGKGPVEEALATVYRFPTLADFEIYWLKSLTQ